LVDRFIRSGGEYLTGNVAAPVASGDMLGEMRLSAGESIGADMFVFALGPWLPKLLPDVVGRRIVATRQEVFFFAPPPGDSRFQPTRMPYCADFNDGDMFYGFPDLESRGVKFAHDVHGAEVDPDTQDRRSNEAALAEIVAFRDRRFP